MVETPKHEPSRWNTDDAPTREEIIRKAAAKSPELGELARRVLDYTPTQEIANDEPVETRDDSDDDEPVPWWQK